MQLYEIWCNEACQENRWHTKTFLQMRNWQK